MGLVLLICCTGKWGILFKCVSLLFQNENPYEAIVVVFPAVNLCTSLILISVVLYKQIYNRIPHLVEIVLIIFLVTPLVTEGILYGYQNHVNYGPCLFVLILVIYSVISLPKRYTSVTAGGLMVFHTVVHIILAKPPWKQVGAIQQEFK